MYTDQTIKRTVCIDLQHTIVSVELISWLLSLFFTECAVLNVDNTHKTLLNLQYMQCEYEFVYAKGSIILWCVGLTVFMHNQIISLWCDDQSGGMFSSIIRTRSKAQSRVPQWRSSQQSNTLELQHLRHRNKLDPPHNPQTPPPPPSKDSISDADGQWGFVWGASLTLWRPSTRQRLHRGQHPCCVIWRDCGGSCVSAGGDT